MTSYIEEKKTHGIDPEQRPFKCNFCDKTFRQPESVRRHVESVHDGARYPCEFCTQTFTLKSNLGTHIRKKHNSDPKNTF